jgi:hypothetical protein
LTWDYRLLLTSLLPSTATAASSASHAVLVITDGETMMSRMMTDADKRAFAREYGDWLYSVPVANQDWAEAIFAGALDEYRGDAEKALAVAKKTYAKNPKPVE